MVPLIIVMVLVLIPAVMTTIAVVREKETGSIANFQSTPISKFEFWWASCSPTSSSVCWHSLFCC